MENHVGVIPASKLQDLSKENLMKVTNPTVTAQEMDQEVEDIKKK